MVSDVFLDKDSEQSKSTCYYPVFMDSKKHSAVLLTFSRQYPPIKSEIRPHVLLVALELDFSWKTILSSHSASNTEDHLTITSHPFSSKLSLPFRGLLDNVIRRFITWQCVKYILIPCCHTCNNTFFQDGILLYLARGVRYALLKSTV